MPSRFETLWAWNLRKLHFVGNHKEKAITVVQGSSQLQLHLRVFHPQGKSIWVAKFCKQMWYDFVTPSSCAQTFSRGCGPCASALFPEWAAPPFGNRVPRWITLLGFFFWRSSAILPLRGGGAKWQSFVRKLASLTADGSFMLQRRFLWYRRFRLKGSQWFCIEKRRPQSWEFPVGGANYVLFYGVPQTPEIYEEVPKHFLWLMIFKITLRGSL